MTTCLVTGTLTTLSGTPLAGALVAVRRDDPGNVVPFTAAGAALADGELRRVTDAAGAFAVSLARGARVVIRIPDLALHFQTQIPDAEAVTLQELVNASL